jgi:hypothetical protein
LTMRLEESPRTRPAARTESRIHLPPAASPRTVGPSRYEEKAPKAREDLPHFIATEGADHEIALIFG